MSKGQIAYLSSLSQLDGHLPRTVPPTLPRRTPFKVLFCDVLGIVNQQVGSAGELDQPSIPTNVALYVGGKNQLLAIHFDSVNKDPLRMSVTVHDRHPGFPRGAGLTFTVDVAHLRWCIWLAEDNHLALGYVADNSH